MRRSLRAASCAAATESGRPTVIGEITPGNSTVFLIGMRIIAPSGMGLADVLLLAGAAAAGRAAGCSKSAFWLMPARWRRQTPNQARRVTSETDLIGVRARLNLPLLVGEFALVVHRGRGAVQVAEADAAAGDVVGGHLQADAVARDDADAALAHLAARVGEHLGAIGELDAELGIRQHLFDGAFHLDHFFLGHEVIIRPNCQSE